MREEWEEVFDQWVSTTAVLLFGEPVTNATARVVRKALLADCIDQFVRDAFQKQRERVLATEGAPDGR